jgi:hypothetical protein
MFTKAIFTNKRQYIECELLDSTGQCIGVTHLDFSEKNERKRNFYCLWWFCSIGTNVTPPVDNVVAWHSMIHQFTRKQFLTVEIESIDSFSIEFNAPKIDSPVSTVLN